MQVVKQTKKEFL